MEHSWRVQGKTTFRMPKRRKSRKRLRCWQTRHEMRSHGSECESQCEEECVRPSEWEECSGWYCRMWCTQRAVQRAASSCPWV